MKRRRQSGALAARGEDVRIALGRLRSQLWTSVGRLRSIAVVLVAGAVVFGVLATDAARTRSAAADHVEAQIGPLFAAASLSGTLSEADATAATTFLVGGLQRADLPRHYRARMRDASLLIVDLARRLERAPQHDGPLRTISRGLPAYSGDVDAARTNNRQGFPVGAAYLRRASRLMRTHMLPAADGIYGHQARSLYTRLREGTSGTALVAVLVPGGVLLGLLVAAQIYVARLSRRIFNLPMLTATVLLVGVLVWTTANFLIAHGRLVETQRSGSDASLVLTSARNLALRARAQQSLALGARDATARDTGFDEFEAIARRLGTGESRSAFESDGLLAFAARIARRSGSSDGVDTMYASYRDFRRVHDRVRVLEENGDISAAVKLAVSPNGDGTRAFDALNSGLRAELATARRSFARAAADARGALRDLEPGIPLLTVAVTLLTLAGLRQRLEDYR